MSDVFFRYFNSLSDHNYHDVLDCTVLALLTSRTAPPITQWPCHCLAPSTASGCFLPPMDLPAEIWLEVFRVYTVLIHDHPFLLLRVRVSSSSKTHSRFANGGDNWQLSVLPYGISPRWRTRNTAGLRSKSSNTPETPLSRSAYTGSTTTTHPFARQFLT